MLERSSIRHEDPSWVRPITWLPKSYYNYIGLQGAPFSEFLACFPPFNEGNGLIYLPSDIV